MPLLRPPVSTGEPVEALGYFEKSLALQPSFREAHVKAASILRDMGRQSDVVHHLTKNAQTSLALAFLEPLEKLQPYDASIVEVSYSKLIRGFAQERNAQAALGAIQEKEAASCELTTADFCNVIGAFGAEGEWNMALELLRTMNETGPAPDANAYLTVFTTLKR